MGHFKDNFMYYNALIIYYDFYINAQVDLWFVVRPKRTVFARFTKPFDQINQKTHTSKAFHKVLPKTHALQP